jgi:hypothetical protein
VQADLIVDLPSRAHPLREAVATILPDASHTLLIRGCVDRSGAGRRALDGWLAAQADAVGAFREPIKWMLPLVLRACTEHRIAPPARLATVLKTAALRSELRTRSFRAIRADVLRALTSAGADAIVLKGAALSELVYPDASLRHAHDVELLIEPGSWDRAGRALARLPFTGLDALEDAPRAELTHASGLPVVLYRRLFQIPFYNVPVDDVWTRTEPASLCGAAARVLSPADAIVHLCGRALHCAGIRSFRWIVDAWYVLDRRRDIDWDVLLRVACARNLAMPLALAVDYLACELDAPVPRAVRERLSAIAAADRAVGPLVALHAARKAAGGAVRLVTRTPTMRGRAAVLRGWALPSIDVLEWATRPRSRWMIVMHAQAFRIARYGIRRVSRVASLLRPRSRQRVQP